MAKTKVNIISGSLGAGKTTSTKKLLAKALPGEKVMLIENKFGKTGIDGDFLKDSGIEVREMDSSCTCCLLVGDFASPLKEILTKYTSGRTIIEPFSIGKLPNAAHAVVDIEEELPVAGNSAVTLVDMKKAKLYTKNFGEFFNNQVQYAKTIILFRADVVDQKKANEAVRPIYEINKDATVIATPISDLTSEKLLEILEHLADLRVELFEELAEEHEHHHHDRGHKHCCHCDKEEHGHHYHHDEEHEHCCYHDGEKHEHRHRHDERHGHYYRHDKEEHEHHHHHDENGRCCYGHDHHHHHHGHDADEVFDSIGLENAPALTRDKLHALLLRLAGSKEFGKVVHAEGVVLGADGGVWFHLNLVPGETEIRRGVTEASNKVYAIGSELKEEAVTREFKA